MKTTPTQSEALKAKKPAASSSAYRALVDNAIYGILRSDRDGQFIAVNRALAEMLGYESHSELMATTATRDLHTKAQEYDRLIEQFALKRPVKGFETEWRRKDGKAIAVRLSGRPLYDELETFDGFELMVEDLTERSKLEAQLRQAQKMEAIGHLTGGIAHDFNNLLTVIVATADMLAEPIELRLPEYKQDLENLRGAAQRGSDMARKLLGFSRRERLAFELVNLGKVAANATMMLRPLLPENIEMRVLRDEVIGVARADTGAVDQILMNLVTNARDAMPNGGTLRIETRVSYLDEDHRTAYGWGDPGEYVTIIVSDTGIGMDAETRRRMFEPFFTTKVLGAGTGLGMPMVFGLVKQHGGYIDVYSEPGKGTVVKVYFPVASGESVAATTPRVTVTPRGTERVLLAEDEESVRRSARRILEGLGYQVEVAGDGAEALELLRKDPNRFALVITDVGMPRLSGPDFYAAARAESIQTPFLFTSAYNADDLRRTDRLAPTLPFLHKPWTLTDFACRVREVLDVAAARAAVRGRTVLLVDDDALTRAVIRTRLEEAGCVVRDAPDAPTALAMYRESPPDLVVTDLAMPEQSGAELIVELRRDYPHARIVAVSGSLIGDRDEVRDAADALGATRALPKPFTSAQLLEVVRDALTGYETPTAD